MGILNGKTILITGAARGIGKECAILAAREGANVLVNDLGGGVAGGDEGAANPAREVADEIIKTGGNADANSDSIATMKGAKNMIAQAIKKFGGLHAVISPAGILRDAMLHKMSEEDWDAVINVHLKGSFNIARASIEHFRDQEEGRYVLFSSTSGLIGNVGQANYAAAKMGIAGLSRILAMEGARKNVCANIIAPFAWTRMIATIPIKDEESAARVERMKKTMRPDQVAQLAVALAAPSCQANGQIFVSRGNELFVMSQPRPLRGMARLEGWTPQTILSHAMPALKTSFEEVENTAGVFSWPPV